MGFLLKIEDKVKSSEFFIELNEIINLFIASENHFYLIFQLKASCYGLDHFILELRKDERIKGKITDWKDEVTIDIEIGKTEI